MCGIVGLFTNKRPILDADENQIGRVLQKLSYRGPDGYGIWKSNAAVLGHRRLSIIDLSDAGAQPFEIPELGLVITFNGEIYNYKELRENLASHGYAFRSHSDTEVILYAYAHFGIDFLSQLRGMFAFCIFDQKKNSILLARDPAGEKPLYYYLDSNRFIFASEIKSFHAFSELDLSLDIESVKAFFALQYVPGPHTVYRNVQRLTPGHALQIGLDHWTCHEITYWSLLDNRLDPATPDEIEEQIRQSVQYRLVADVEVGLLLSGGIDSALLAACAAASGAKLRAFTARFDEKDLDESKYAQQVAAHLNFQQVVVSGGQLTSDLFEKIIFHGDELLGDPACVPTYLLSREIAKHVKVVLSGEGADELFWGYDTYRLERTARLFLWLNGVLSRSAGFRNRVSRWEVSDSASPVLTRLGKVLSARYDVGAARWTSVFGDNTVDQLIATNGHARENHHLQDIETRLAELKQHMRDFDASLSIDLLYWLADDLLMKVDRMTMAHGVEARAPFLDPGLISRALSLPHGEKIRSRNGKFMLRRLVEERFPSEVGRNLAWRKKHGFEVPVNTWLRENLRANVEEHLSPQKLSQVGFVNIALVTKLKENFYKSSFDTPLKRKLWMLLCFQTWYQQYKAGFGFA